MPNLVDIKDSNAVVDTPDIAVVAESEPEPKVVDEAVKVDEAEDVEPGEIGDEEEYWPGGPKGSEVKEWKKVYGDIYVTSVTPDKHIVWRTLTRFEYRRLVKALDQQASSGQVTQAEANLNNEESIAETVILFPPYKRTEVSGYMAGIASLISQEAMEASGFVALEIRQL